MFHSFRRIAVVCSLMSLAFASATRAEDKYKLEEPVDDIRIFGVGTRVDVKGTVKFAKAADHEQIVSAALSYRERRLLGPGTDAEGLRAAREYETAQADIRVGEKLTRNELPDALKLIVAQGRNEGVELSSLNGLMSADELMLIRSPADSLALISLLPTREVEVGDKWTVSNWAFQMLTALDAVAKGQMFCTLDSINKGVAKITIEGTLDGAAEGAFTEVKVTGSYSYNIEEKYISESDFVQTEKRAVGPVGPGMDVTARVRVLRQPSKVPGRLGDQKIIDVASRESAANSKFVRFETPWNIGGQHSRNWHLCQVDEKVAQFRLLHEGNFIAQCDMAAIAIAKPGEHLAEQVYLTDVRQALGDRLRTMTKGEVIPASNRRYVFKVMAEGSVADKPVSWVFYLIADPSGRQASMMFTADTPLAEKLAMFDRELVDSLKFGPAPVTRAANNK